MPLPDTEARRDVVWRSFEVSQPGVAALLAEGEEELGGGDDLASVALGVVRDVNKEAADGGGEFLAADSSGEFNIRGGEIADAGGGVVERFVKFVEDASDRSR